MHTDLEGYDQIVFSNRHPCEWGTFSLVRATQDAAALLLERFPDVTHVMVVSGSCLPLRPVADLTAFLSLHPHRDFIESVTAEDVGWTVGGLNEERFTMRFPLPIASIASCSTNTSSFSAVSSWGDAFPKAWSRILGRSGGV